MTLIPSVFPDDDEDFLPSVIPDEEDLLPSVKTESLLSSAHPEDIVVVVIDDWRLLSSGCPLGVVVWRLIELPIKLLDQLAVLLEDDGWDVAAITKEITTARSMKSAISSSITVILS